MQLMSEGAYVSEESQGCAGSVAFEDHAGVCIARLSGRLAGEGCWPELDRLVEGALARAESGVVVDLAGVTHVESPLLGKLLRLGQRCREGELPLKLAGAPPTARRVIELMDIAATLDHHATVAEAVAAVRGG
jgi:anti-anti-sigma regulatory factor